MVALWYRAWRQALPGLRHPQSLEQWRLRFCDEIALLQVVWVAVDDIDASRILGFMTMVVADGYIDQLFVDPHAQGRGVGAALMTKAKELAPNGLALHTLQRNTPACTFYERQGFIAGEVGVNPINGLPNIWYRWDPVSHS